MAQSRPGLRKLWAPASIGLIAAAMIAVVIFGSNSPSESPAAPQVVTPEDPVVSSPPEVSPPQRVNMDRRDEADPLAIGDIDAPVSLVMYSDFQCTYCALWATQSLPTMLEYVDDGQMRIEWRDIAFFGDASYVAALGGVAAGNQDKYLEFNQAVFASGTNPPASMLTEEGLAGVAEEIGLDVERFVADMASDETETLVQYNMNEAQELGVTSTPTFLINGVPIMGAQPVEVFTEAIDSELATS